MPLDHETSSRWCGESRWYSNYRPRFNRTLVSETFLLCPKNERQQSVNDSWPYIREIAQAAQWCYPIIVVLAAFLGKNSCNDIATLSSKWASMVCQWLLGLYQWESEGFPATLSHDQSIGCLSRQNWLRRHRYFLLEMSLTGALPTLGHASWTIRGPGGDIKT